MKNLILSLITSILACGLIGQSILTSQTIVFPPIESCGQIILDAGCNDYNCYAWSTGASGVQTIQVNTSGTYTVEVGYDLDGDGICDFTYLKEFSVTIFPNPIVNLGPDQQFCDGATTVLDAGVGQDLYLWGDGETTQTINVSISGSYSVTVTDNNGCTATDDVIITIFQGIDLSDISATETCSDNGTATVNPIGGTTPYTYLWSDGQTTQTAEGLGIGNYTVIVTDIIGCTATEIVQVNQSLYCSTLPCGNSYTTMSTYSAATAVPGAVGYIITFYDLAGNLVSTYTLPGTNPRTFFYLFSDIFYNQTYNWTVQVQYLDDSGTLQTGPESNQNCTITFEEPLSVLPCGNSYTTMSTYTAATNVHGAVGYIITFYDLAGNLVSTYTLPGTNPRTFFYLFSDIFYNQTYNWTVQVQYLDTSGTLQTGPESNQNCTITFEEPLSVLPCGNSYTTMSTYTAATNVHGAVGYIITFYDLAGNLVSTYTLPGNNPRTFFYLFSDIFYNQTYNWTVQVQYLDASGTLQTGPESNQNCTITFEEPLSELPCGSTFTTMNTYSSATSVYGAVEYIITFYDLAGNPVSTYTLPGNNPRTFFYLFPNLSNNQTYNWTVQVQYLDASGTLQTGPESDLICSITFGP